MGLGIWTATVGAQTDSPCLFTHGGEVSFDTSAGEVSYALDILNNSYQLSADGNAILSGTLKNYSAFGAPYNVGNYLFLGDNTSSAGADVVLGAISLSTLTAVPLPLPLLLLGASLAGLFGIRARRRI